MVLKKRRKYLLKKYLKKKKILLQYYFIFKPWATHEIILHNLTRWHNQYPKVELRDIGNVDTSFTTTTRS